METTSARLDALSAAQSELKNLEKLWAATDRSLQALAAPAGIQERTRSVLGSIKEVRVQVNTVSDKVLLLESELSKAKLDAEEALEAIDDALLERHSKLLAIEYPPIWKMIGPGAGREPISTELRAAVAEGRRALRQYAARARTDLLVQLALFVGLVVAFYRLRHGSRAWPSDNRGLRACARLVQWPINAFEPEPARRVPVQRRPRHGPGEGPRDPARRHEWPPAHTSGSQGDGDDPRSQRYVPRLHGAVLDVGFRGLAGRPERRDRDDQPGARGGGHRARLPTGGCRLGLRLKLF